MEIINSRITELKVGDTEATSYTFPTSRGTNGQTLISDGSGNLTFGSAGINGTGDTGRVTLWASTSALTSDSSFTYSSDNLKIGDATALWSLNNRFTISENIDGIVNIEYTNKSTDAGARIINIWGQSTSNYAIISRLSPNWGVLGFQSVDASDSYSIQNNTTTGGTGGGSIILNGNPIYLMPGADVDAPALKLDNSSVYINTNENIHNSPDGSAALEIVSTSKGFLPPRMDGLGIETISAPAEGLIVYCNNGNGSTVNASGYWIYNGSTWVQMGQATSGMTSTQAFSPMAVSKCDLTTTPATTQYYYQTISEITGTISKAKMWGASGSNTILVGIYRGQLSGSMTLIGTGTTVAGLGSNVINLTATPSQNLSLTAGEDLVVGWYTDGTSWATVYDDGISDVDFGISNTANITTMPATPTGSASSVRFALTLY